MALSNLPQTTAVIEVDGERIEDTLSFCYSSDMLQIGDPFSVAVANVRGKYNGKLAEGSKITLRLSNALVNNGAATMKHTGRIVHRDAIADGGPSRIQLDCADLGWHLRESDAPLKYNLQRGKYGDLFGEAKINGEIVPFIDRKWGFPGDYSGPGGTWRARVNADNAASRALRQGIRLSKGQAAATNLAGVFKRVYVVQVEPGDKVADLLMLYARRFNLLLNVGADGTIQLWNPDYSQKVSYKIEYHEIDDSRRTQNSILSARARSSIEGRFTEVNCVGEIVGLEFAQLDPNDPNAGKVYGAHSAPDALPFPRRKTFCDGEMFNGALAKDQAFWTWKRSYFDSFVYEARVWQHHQEGVWWESDTLCDVDDTVNGIRGTFYVQSVKYERTREGDVTDIVLRLPKLLSASFGVLPSAPYAQFNPNLTKAIK